MMDPKSQKKSGLASKTIVILSLTKKNQIGHILTVKKSNNVSYGQNPKVANMFMSEILIHFPLISIYTQHMFDAHQRMNPSNLAQQQL